MPTFPNVEYAASGYDIVLGNPAAQSVDPGEAGETLPQTATHHH
jgi:hypothetical protein